MNLKELTKEKYFNPNFFKPSNVIPTMMDKKIEATKLPAMLKKSFKDLENVSGLHKEIAQYLVALLDNAVSDKPIPADLIQKLKKNPLLKSKGDSNRAAILGINTDLGEIYGSLWAAYHKKYFGLGPEDICILFPRQDNYALVDYEVYAKVPVKATGAKSKVCEHKRTHTNKTGQLNAQKQTLVSAKTAGTANTIKFHDILKKLGEKPDLLKFWRGTVEYEVAEYLAEKGPQLGPIYALKELCDEGIAPKNLMPKQLFDTLVKLYDNKPGNAKIAITEAAPASSLSKIATQLKPLTLADSTLSERYISKGSVMLRSNKSSVDAAEKNILLGYITVACEKQISSIMGEKGKAPMYDLVRDALSGEVDYMVYNIGGNLIPTYNFASKDSLNFGGGPRSKNSMSGRVAKKGIADALGFGPHFK